MNSFKIFRIVALTEATSFVLLLMATAAKYGIDEPLGVEILGPVHGTLFLAYIGIAMFTKIERNWSIGCLLLVMLGAVVPFGGYVVDRWFTRSTTA